MPFSRTDLYPMFNARQLGHVVALKKKKKKVVIF